MGAGGSISRGHKPSIGSTDVDADTVQFILTDEIALQYFSKFCSLEDAKDSQLKFSLFGAFSAVDKMTREHLAGQAINFVIPSPPLNAPFADFLAAHLTQNYIVSEVDKQDPDLRLEECLQNIQKDLLGIMMVRYFPAFLKSKQYADYCKHVNNFEETAGSASLAIRSVSSFREDNSKNLRLSQAFTLMQSGDVQNLMETDYWLRPLFACCDNLPVCVCISSASRERWGFPVIYVNKEFERITLFESKDIVGKSCRILQDEYDLHNSVSEQNQVAMLAEALRAAKPVNVGLSNKRKDGNAFRNLLSMKPIFDQHGTYRYVLSVQFDIYDRDATQKKLKVAQNILSMLPDVLYVNDDEKHFKPNRALIGLAVDDAVRDNSKL